ncbi:MAG: hypothetical protein BWY81_00866 [Firmicutes bacterium ADurb.Bin467]|nr:MAG: hypothetical protein BWY81_00866 [Firmicutes bacterium ADurb.Bin467]
MSPPCSPRISRTIESPIPRPACFVVKPRSKIVARTCSGISGPVFATENR